VHRIIALASLLAVALFSGECGSSNTPTQNNINGNWTAALTNPDGSLAFRFSATFAQGSGSQLSITDLTYTSSSSCPVLASMNSAGGTFTATSGTFTMGEIFTNVGGPALDLQGKASNSLISGQWTLSGVLPECSGNGSFTIQPTTAG